MPFQTSNVKPLGSAFDNTTNFCTMQGGRTDTKKEAVMAFHFRCVNCGYEQEAHDPNLVNEPAEGDYVHIETAADGYPMSILECMETRWPADYAEQVKDLYWGKSDWYGTGYVSPEPEQEVAEFDSKPKGLQTSVIIFFVRGRSVAIPIE